MISGIIALASLALTVSCNTKMKNLDNHLSRIGLPSSQQLHHDEFQMDRATLALVMDGQSRSMAFENLDVVMKKIISVNGSDVEKKLADDLRGGHCWEQNALLQMALEEMGCSVKPILCRVRWGKADDAEGPNTGHTHFALKVTTADGCHFLADVGFAGTNSVEPINLDVGPESQESPEGCFRVIASTHERFHVLEQR
jgi:N-hydroxyarylamine O-acetyltransferase